MKIARTTKLKLDTMDFIICRRNQVVKDWRFVLNSCISVWSKKDFLEY